LNVELAPKRLELLHEVVPTTRSIALLIDPASPFNERLSTDTQTAANTLGLQLHILHASTERDFDTVFESLVQIDGGEVTLWVNRVISGAGSDVRFSPESDQIAASY